MAGEASLVMVTSLASWSIREVALRAYERMGESKRSSEGEAGCEDEDDSFSGASGFRE